MEEKKARQLVITGVRQQARNTRSFDLRCSEAVDFTPGQVAILRVEGEEPAYFAFASAPDDFCYRDETDDWEAAGVELRQVISRPDGHDWSGPTGYVQSLLDHVLPDLASPVALICGSREMIDQTRERLSKMGFKPEEILTNY
jgi:NAD(P)H-flavin reductase